MFAGGVMFVQVISFYFGTMVGYEKCKQDMLTLVLPEKLRNLENRDTLKNLE